jgi:hypothetical protein
MEAFGSLNSYEGETSVALSVERVFVQNFLAFAKKFCVTKHRKSNASLSQTEG